MEPKDVNKHNFDAILLSDYCHDETLQKLDKSLMVIANFKAANICQDLGFTNVVQLDHGKSTEVGKMRIHAFPGHKD